jgi:hypothetical protein
MSDSFKHPDGNYYFRSGDEIVSCPEDMSKVYPNDMIPPDDPTMVAKWQSFNDTKYQRDRQPEYPPIADQQDMQFHDAIDGTTTWQDAIQAVKGKYPKPE